MDFLTRLVERQRSESTGLRPVLPSRFEPDSAVRLDDENSYVPTSLAAREPLPVPGHIAETAKASPPAPAPQPQPERKGPALPPLQPVEARPRSEDHTHVYDPPPRLVPPSPPNTHQPSAERNGSTHQPTPEPKGDGPQPDPLVAPALCVVPAADAPPTPALPEPLVPASGEEKPPAIPFVIGQELQPEPTTIAISIGRIELVPPSPVTEHEPAMPAPATTAPHPPYRPRLSLEDYLARPNRGRR